MAEARGPVDVQSLQEVFKEGWDAQKDIEKDEFTSNSEQFKVQQLISLILWIALVSHFQGLVINGIRCLEQATHLANQLSLFSPNEALEDVSTTDLK